METNGQPDAAKRAVEELRVIEEAHKEVWAPPPAQTRMREHPYVKSAWLVVVALLAALAAAYVNEDGWKSWIPLVALLALSGVSLAVERWFQRERGVRLHQFPPVKVNKQPAKVWLLQLACMAVLLLGLFWLQGKPYWLVFSTLLVFIGCAELYTDYRYRSQRKGKIG